MTKTEENLGQQNKTCQRKYLMKRLKKKSMTHFNAQGQQLTGDKVQVEIITWSRHSQG